MYTIKTCAQCSKIVGTHRAVCIVHVVVVNREQAACGYFKKNSVTSTNPLTVGLLSKQH